MKRSKMATKQEVKRLMYCYAGSKRRLAPKLVQLFPPHKTYLCPFLGTGAEFAFKKPSRREIASDLDGNVYSVFSTLRDERLFRRLLHRLENSHDCRQLYYECYDRLSDKTLTPLDRAYCFLMIGNLGYQGGHPMTSRSYSSHLSKKKKLTTLLPAVLAWRQRMKNVQIENVDAFDLLDRYDNPEVFTFLDPPYHPETCHEGLYTHTEFDHRRLVERLQKFKGKVLLCGYEHGLYDVQLLGWRRQEFHVSKSFGGRAPRTEIVWMNYDAAGKRLRQDFSLIRAFEELPA